MTAIIERDRSFLETCGKLTGISILVIARFALLINWWNYNRLVETDRPRFVIIPSRLLQDNGRQTLDVSWTSVRKKTARNGKARPCELTDDGKRGDQLAEEVGMIARGQQSFPELAVVWISMSKIGQAVLDLHQVLR